jgi:hypothetical protein
MSQELIQLLLSLLQESLSSDRKLLQERQSALDRINVRRLVIYLRSKFPFFQLRFCLNKTFKQLGIGLNRLIEPFLANVKTRFGIVPIIG